MNANPADPAPPAASTSRAPRLWALLALALGWIALTRAPLILNAGAHLDSDLAVDGLTLIDALHGRWRWHYPATPFIGTPPVLLSYVQARLWGVGPATLASGGVAAYGLLVAATCWWNRRAFGPSVAAWGLVPLAFASTGVVWLSGRVTGGHLLAAAWHAGAFAMAWGALAKGGWRRSAALGAWCGFGLSVDSMFAVTWAGLGVAACVFVRIKPSSPLLPGEGPAVGAVARRARSKLVDSGAIGEAVPPTPGPSPEGKGESTRPLARWFACLLAFAVGGVVGVAPRVIGLRVDPHDAYVGQFTPALGADRLARNAGLLLRDCLPRLVAGHRLPGLQSEPDPARLANGSNASAGESVTWVASAVALGSIALFFGSIRALATGEPSRPPSPSPASTATRAGLMASSLAVVAGFLVHPSITDSDNYRYLVFLLVPWSSGFGLMMGRFASGGRRQAWAAGALAAGFAALMTVDTARWYARLGYVDPVGRPIRKAVEEPAVDWLDDHLRVSTILGDYWDVYRISFLTQGRVRAVPFPQYPDRFPEVSRGLATAKNPVVIVRPGPFGPIYREKALAGGGREVLRARGLSIVQWPRGMTP